MDSKVKWEGHIQLGDVDSATDFSLIRRWLEWLSKQHSINQTGKDKNKMYNEFTFEQIKSVMLTEHQM